jgi:hypothetical protein
MEPVVTQDTPHYMSHEEFMAEMREFRESFNESLRKSREEADRRMKEADRRMQEEADRRMKEDDRRMKEAERRMQEEDELRTKEFDRQVQEAKRRTKEIDLQMKETDRRLGELGNRFGELAEHLVRPSIMEKFNKLGFHFTESSQDKVIKEPGNPNAYAEIDILLENDDTVIAVEVKAKPLQKDVDVHASRMEVLRRRANTRHDTREFQGAIAGAIMTSEVRDYSHKAGFYVIEQTGDTVKITIPKGFKPRVW